MPWPILSRAVLAIWFHRKMELSLRFWKNASHQTRQNTPKAKQLLNSAILPTCAPLRFMSGCATGNVMPDCKLRAPKGKIDNIIQTRMDTNGHEEEPADRFPHRRLRRPPLPEGEVR